MGSYKYPYQLYDFTDADSLPKQLGAFGYDTVAMHPMTGTNYNRSTNYKRLGFDTFMDIAEFEGEPIYHAGVRDRSTYDKILSVLRSDEDPQFIFDVTMQNHGGYAAGTVHEEDYVDYGFDGILEPEVSMELNTYLACIEAADQDLEYFVCELKKLDRPVVLVLLGNHQPNISWAINDALHPEEDEFLHRMRTFETNYLVWANYEVEGSFVKTNQESSASQLAAEALYSIGAPLSDLQKCQMALSSEIISVSLPGYRESDDL